MTQHEIASRAHHWVISVICCIAMGAVAANLDNKRAAEDAAQVAIVAKQARAAAQPDTWARLDKQARQMVAVDRIGK